MPVKTAKMTDTVAARVGAARQLVGTRIVPVAVPAGRKAAAQTRQLVGERIMPAVGPAGRKAATLTRLLFNQRIAPVVGPFGRKAAKQTRAAPRPTDHAGRRYRARCLRARSGAKLFAAGGSPPPHFALAKAS